MEQHPIPQNVSSYQFKLVGDMTLKQFFQLAGGILVGLMFYSAPLLGIIKWPLTILSVLVGIGLAFLPLEERPLEKWIFAFFRAIYSPTIFNWKQTTSPIKYFQDEPAQTTVPEDPNLKNYLSTVGKVSDTQNNLDQAEKGFLAKLAGLFTIQPTPQKPSEPPVEPAKAPDIGIPVSQPTIVQTEPAHLVVEEKPVVQNTQNQVTTNLVSPIAGNEMISTRQAIFSVEAAPPSPPTYPNVIVGQVVDQDRRIVEGAIMEIRDSMGRPIRALRSNRVGHFVTVTQLDSGHYEIITEKDGYEFMPVNFDATGSIIPPILVSGKRLGPIIEKEEEIVKPRYSIN